MSKIIIIGDGGLVTTPSGGGGTSDVNLVEIVGTAAAVNNGAATAGTLRTATASDSPEVVSVASIDTKTPALGGAATAAAVPVSIANDQNVPVQGDTAHDAVDAGSPVAIGGNAQSTQAAPVTAGRRVRAVFNLFGELVIAGYNWATNSVRTSENDPLDQRYDEELFVLTNVPNATPDETILIDMRGYQSCSVHVEKTGASGDTFTWTMESNGESALSTDDWIDTTQFGWTSATVTSAATYTADGIIYSNRGFNPSGHKVKIETAGTGDDADFKVSVKRYY